MKLITRDIIPCWHELSWNEKKTAIVLRASSEIIRKHGQFSERFIKLFMDEFRFKTFSGDLNSDFGFENVVKLKKIEPDFSEFEIAIPRIEKYTRRICTRCKGKKVDPLYGDNHPAGPKKCFDCKGKGMERIVDWNLAYAISASLSLFFRFESLVDENLQNSRSQLLEISLATKKGEHGGSIDGKVSVPLANWLFSLEEKRFEKAESVLKKVWRRMYRNVHEYDERKIRVEIGGKNGRLAVSCPGDRCCIYPDSHSSRRGEGYNFSCHNVDTPMQQIMFLAALAVIHDEARLNHVGLNP